MSEQVKSLTGKAKRSPVSATSVNGRLKQIKTGLSSDGHRIQMQFVTDQNNATTVRLEPEIAMLLHTRLGELLTQLIGRGHSRRQHLH